MLRYFLMCVIATVVCLTGCKRGMRMSMWSEDNLTMPQGVEPSNLPEAASRGARLTGRYCSQCHGIPSPASHSAQDWIPVFRRMVMRLESVSNMGGMMGRGGMRMMHGNAIETPSFEEEQAILEYLQVHAMQTVQPAELPESGSVATDLFIQKCSRCHALPNPSQHAPAEWSTIVERMREHMRQMVLADLTDAESQTLVAYLQTAAKPQ